MGNIGTLKLVGGFCVRVVLLYGLLIAPWPGVQEGYGALYRYGAETIFGDFGRGGVVQFVPLSGTDPMRDTEIILKKRHAPAVGRLPTSSRYGGYVPTAFLTALVLATPIRWSRRGLALFWGLLLVSVYVGFRLGLTLLNSYSGDHALALYDFSVFWKQVLSFTTEVVSVAISGAYIPPIFIWILVTFRHSELAKLVPGPTP